MVFDLSNVIQYIFIASFGAAGLAYAVGHPLIESLSRAIQNTEKECNIITSPNTKPNYNKKAEMLLLSLKFNQKLITIIITVDMVIFLFCSLLIMLYWIFNDNLCLTVGVILFFIGISGLVIIIVTSRLSGKILKTSIPSNDT